MKTSINSNMEQYAIYLRKSRKDIEAESLGAGETLARHENIMLELAKRKNIIIGRIYREIVSGDSISSRPVMQELLQDVEEGLWTGILVMEVERLARGNTLDQGIVAETFKYSSTKIITPSKDYDPNNEFDEEYFEFGLFMSRREYKTIRRRLHNGTIASVKEGKLVTSVPFGYDKYKLPGKGYSLKPNENAKIVQMIYEMYTNGKNLGEIISTLNNLNIKTPKGGIVWYKSTLQKILTNITYTGKIKYIDEKNLKKRNELGRIIYVKNPNPTIYIVNGLHEAIISEDIFNKAQAIYKNHQLADTRTKEQFALKNPLSSLIKCQVCGCTLKRKTNNTSYVGIRCKEHHVASSHLDIVEKKVLESLQMLLNEYKLDIASSNSQLEIQSLIDNSEKQIKQLNDELEKTYLQKEKLYDFLEQGIYDKETFLNRSQLLASKISDIKNKTSELEALKLDYITLKGRKENIIPTIEKVIETYPHANIEQKNKLLKSCLKKIEYYKEPNCRKQEEFKITLFPLL